MPAALFSWALMKMPCSDEDLVTRCLREYWDPKHSQAFLRSRSRMRGVIQLLAHEVRQWAPDKGQAKICNLAINEVADRLLRDSEDHDVPA
jgi:hypothetical protein